MKKTLTKRQLVAAVAVASVLGMSGGAVAATDNMTVEVTVSGSCTINAETLTFPDYDPIAGSPVQASAQLSVTCAGGTTPTVGLDAGLNYADASGTSRALKAGTGETLEYELYSDSERTEVWDDITNRQSVDADGTVKTLLVYGEILGGQTSAVNGAYTDTVQVTVDF